jgi:uncharacterized protein YceH (UPF0502 family)
MDGELDPTERRIVGVLIEKALSTPAYYPMTLNALVAACNQKNNRDPVTGYAEFEVEGALRSLFEKKWITYAEGGGRVRKWRHRVDEQLGLSAQELAVLAELLLRGPQQPGELRTRCERMAPIPTPEALTGILDALGKRTPPLVVRLGRQSGERADRYGQTLASDDAAARAAAPGAPAAAPAAPAATPVPAVAPPSAPSPDLTERVERLESQLAELRREIESLRGRAAGPPASVPPQPSLRSVGDPGAGSIANAP